MEPLREEQNNFNNEQEQTQQFIDDFINGLDEKEKALKKRRRRPKRFPVWPGVLLLAALLVMGGSILYHYGILQGWGRQLSALVTKNKTVVSQSVPEQEGVTDESENQSAESSGSGTETAANAEAPAQQSSSAAGQQTTAPQKIFAAGLTAGVEYNAENPQAELSAAVNSAAEKGLTTLFLSLNKSGGLLTDTETGTAAFHEILALAKSKQISIFATVDVSQLNPELVTQSALSSTCQKVGALAKTADLSGLMLTGYTRNKKGADYAEYLKTGNLNGYTAYSQGVLSNAVQAACKAVRQANPALYLGLICNDVYATSDLLQNGMAVKAENQLLRDENADVLAWAKQGYFDTVFVRADTTTDAKDIPFETVAKWWSEQLPTSCNIGYILSGTAAVKQQGAWKNPDQLARQLKCLNSLNRYVFCVDSLKALETKNSEAAAATLDYIAGDYGNDYILTNLSFTAPAKRSFTVFEDKITFNGASDPKFKLTLNGKEVERNEYGYFVFEEKLNRGNNTFTFTHKGSTETFQINYRYVVIKEVAPSSALKLDGGSTLVVKALARSGSKVTATLNGSTVQLSAGAEETQGSEFIYYTGSFALPDGYAKDTSLGKVTFKGTHNGVTESATGGKITVRKTTLPSSIRDSDTGVTPSGGGYINVGSGYVAEVTKYQAETFSGKTVDDYSQPFNNYFPKGTIDYCSPKTVYDPESGGTYYKLRCGRRVYAKSKNGANVKAYAKTLPGKNNVSVKSFAISGHRSVLTLDVDWKAPFLLDVLPQKYNLNNVNKRGRVSSVTFNYIDITLCYAAGVKNSEKINLANNPLFSKVQVIQNSGDCTLRFYLKRTGAFYGWTADYNSSGDLVFTFLNPVHAKAAANKYGGTLNGIKITVDAGHGGSDGGASGSNKNFNEAERSLLLAKKVEAKLKSIGATVTMTRTSNTGMSQDDRVLRVRNAMPDLAVSVHRNAATSASANGYYSFYFNPYTVNPAGKITAQMQKTGVYKSYNTDWHYFYLSRISTCPVVLTENGFMSNSYDYSAMLDDAKQEKCADAIVKGIVDHFLNQ